MIIALDAMSGDFGVDVTVPAAQKALERHEDLELILVGQADALHTALSKHGLLEHRRLRVMAASEVVGMDEAPAKAMRGKKDSSMRVAIN
ncbi:MAG: phosphate acyltransferase PlsX, partial [Oceanococcus sp.]